MFKSLAGTDVSLIEKPAKVFFVDFWCNACVPCRFYHKRIIEPLQQRYADNSNVIFISVNVDPVDEWGSFKAVTEPG